jgi:hypothetical protein
LSWANDEVRIRPYLFSRIIAFATIPKACGFEAATRFPTILLGVSLIPIYFYRDGDGFPWLNIYIRPLSGPLTRYGISIHDFHLRKAWEHQVINQYCITVVHANAPL